MCTLCFGLGVVFGFLWGFCVGFVCVYEEVELWFGYVLVCVLVVCYVVVVVLGEVFVCLFVDQLFICVRVG